jgi:hypothetical protein
MFFPLIYWVVLPMLLGWLVIRWINKHAPLRPAGDVAALFERDPGENFVFPAAHPDAKGLVKLGDFEKQPDAVDAAYLGKEQAQKAGEKAEFLVFNHKAELLEQVDS